MVDLFAPKVSKVSKDLTGKSFLCWGSNRTGKTSVACSFPKPLHLAFESGLAGIDGVPFFVMDSWRTFVDLVKQLVDPKNAEKAHEAYQTIIVDSIEPMANLCADYVCSKFGLTRLGERMKTASGKEDYSLNLYHELDIEHQKWMRKLLLAGYTVIYIGHETTREMIDPKTGETYQKRYPRGDRRIVDALCDNCDIIGHTLSNGMDENGMEIKSSLVLADSKAALAGSRFDYLPAILPEFSAKALTDAIAKAVEMEEKASGSKAVSFEEQSAPYKEEQEKIPFDKLKADIGVMVQKMIADGRAEEYSAIVEADWGKGKKVSEAAEVNREAVEMIYEDLVRLGYSA